MDGTLESPLPIRMSFWRKIHMVHDKTGRLGKFRPAVISGRLSLKICQQAITRLNKDVAVKASCSFVH